MELLRRFAPVFWSKTFWGLTLAMIFKVAAFYGWAEPGLLDIISTWIFGVTGVNIIWKTAKKINRQ